MPFEWEMLPTSMIRVTPILEPSIDGTEQESLVSEAKLQPGLPIGENLSVQRRDSVGPRSAQLRGGSQWQFPENRVSRCFVGLTRVEVLGTFDNG